MQHSTNGQPVVRAERVFKTYRDRNLQVEALRGVDLEVSRGEFAAIMGPSGSGKSTLLNLLGGLDEPTQGAVFVDGARLAGMNERQRALLRRDTMGFVFQDFDLLPLLTVQENVEFPLAVAGVDAKERARRAVDLLASVGLEDKRAAWVDELSGGQKQRLAIARALANQPAVILADEPTGSLDSITGRDVLLLLREAIGSGGTSVVMVTHDPEDAQVADRIISLRDGLIDGVQA